MNSTLTRPNEERPHFMCVPPRPREATVYLSVNRLSDGDIPNVLAEFLGFVDEFDFAVNAIYIDSEFYDEKCLTLMQVHNCVYVIPTTAW